MVPHEPYGHKGLGYAVPRYHEHELFTHSIFEGTINMRKLNSNFKPKYKFEKIYGIQITMVNGDKIYSDANGWGQLEADTIVSIKEYKHNADGSFTYDSYTYVNPKYILYARPMMITICHSMGDVDNA